MCVYVYNCFQWRYGCVCVCICNHVCKYCMPSCVCMLVLGVAVKATGRCGQGDVANLMGGRGTKTVLCTPNVVTL